MDRGRRLGRRTLLRGAAAALPAGALGAAVLGGAGRAAAASSSTSPTSLGEPVARAVTASGTPWSTWSAVLPGHGETRWWCADARVGDGGLRTLLHLHGAGGTAHDLETVTLWRGVRERLVDEGWLVVEGAGGESAIQAGYSWGNPAARAAYRAYLEHVGSLLDLGPLVVLGRSMGGVGAANLYLHDDLVAPWASGLVLHQAALNLVALSEVPREGNEGSGSGRYWPTLWSAYGASSHEEFLAVCGPHDVLQAPAEAWRGARVWVGVATGDLSVPPAVHGLALRERWGDEPALDRLVLREGGNHTTQGVFDRVDELLAFLDEVTAV